MAWQEAKFTGLKDKIHSINNTLKELITVEVNESAKKITNLANILKTVSNLKTKSKEPIKE